MMIGKTLTLTDSQQMGGEAGMEDAAYCATTLHKISCASADPSDTETAAARDDAIFDLSGMKDGPKGVLTHYEVTLNVQQPGFAHPSWTRASCWTMCH